MVMGVMKEETRASDMSEIATLDHMRHGSNCETENLKPLTILTT
jgi:hypothetical protein